MWPCHADPRPEAGPALGERQWHRGDLEVLTCHGEQLYRDRAYAQHQKWPNLAREGSTAACKSQLGERLFQVPEATMTSGHTDFQVRGRQLQATVACFPSGWGPAPVRQPPDHQGSPAPRACSHRPLAAPGLVSASKPRGRWACGGRPHAVSARLGCRLRSGLPK